MTPVAAIPGSMITAADRAAHRDGAPAAATSKTASSRALIPLQPVARGDTGPRNRPQAGFLAHLIATAAKLPQTRERRRAEPSDVIAIYTAADAAPPLAGRLLRVA